MELSNSSGKRSQSRPSNLSMNIKRANRFGKQQLFEPKTAELPKEVFGMTKVELCESSVSEEETKSQNNLIFLHKKQSIDK
jgi:hypothetical protein